MKIRWTVSLFAILFGIPALALSQTPPTPAAVPLASASDTPRIAPPPVKPATADNCQGGVIKDDGDPETGYGFVPSAKAGIYVQRFEAAELAKAQKGKLSQVCICFMKTRAEDEANFEVVFYEDAGDRPAEEPYAVVPSRATELPKTKEDAGRFYGVDVPGVALRPGTAWIGARWNPSEARYFFICTDTNESSSKVPVFFREDLSRGWASVFTARDPIFKPHRSILVRVK